MKTLFSAILLLSLAAVLVCPPSAGAALPSGQKKTTTVTKAERAKTKKKRAAVTRRMRRAQRAFVVSSDLKPMARQLLENRTRAGYAAIEAYARRHSHDDAGALARLVLGYAHVLDHDYVRAIEPLKRAESRGGELDDYVSYFLGTAYGLSGDSVHAVDTLHDFDSKFPGSLFARDAAVVYANALLTQNQTQAALAALEAHRNPPRSDIELALGRAYLKAGDNKQATEVLRRVYFGLPLSAEAEDAKVLLATIADAPPAEFSLRKLRADVLLQGHRSRDAADEYRQLLGDVPAAQRPGIELALAVALRRSGEEVQARDMLEHFSGSAEQTAQRLYYLADIARSDNDEDRFVSLLAQLREAGPTSGWLEEALLSGGNMYLLAQKYDQAIDLYRELQERFPNGRYGAYVQWKAAWLTLRQGRTEQARQAFEQQIALYPNSPQVPAAVYWRARMAENEGDTAKAQTWYRKILERYPNYYYADLARARLKSLKPEVQAPEDALLQKIAPTRLPTEYSATAPEDNLRVQKAMLLRNGALYDFAAKELQLAAADGGASWAPAELARLYADAGEYHRALQTLKRAVPTYYSLELEALPRFYWETLFPRPFWTDLKRFSVRNQLDPFLVASLIRQESEFNPGAVSRANALGLMQLLPGTGRLTARELRVRPFRAQLLLTPNVNLRLGTTYFRHVLDQFNGKLEYALAAYNAGSDRVEAWLQEGNFHDPEEFVESIPFTETREYVQAILRNANVYRRLYSKP